MTKLELNDKVAELYGELNFKYASKYLNIKIFLIDDWSRLMGLAVDNGICIHIYEDCVMCAKPYSMMPTKEFYENHESPQATTKYAIAMALVKSAEDK